MEENLVHLYEDILNSTANCEHLLKEFANIKGASITCGAGGSRVVAEFLRLVLEKKNKCLVNTCGLRDLNHLDLKQYKNLIITSHSGSNYGVRQALEKEATCYLLSTRKTKVKGETLLHYEMENRKSFIALNATIVPMAILLKYYLEDAYTSTLERIFAHLDKEVEIPKSDVINIFSGVDTKVAEVFLDSTLVEAGLGIPIIHSKYDYCHGRSTLNKSHQYSAIYLENLENDLDRVIKQVLENSMNDFVLIKGFSEDEVINQFYITLQIVYLCVNLAKEKNVDLANIKYDKMAVKSLYYFKGSM